jgi:Domain of unknown function (DUF4112)
MPLTPVSELGAAERDRLERLRRLGYLLDNSIPIPGTRFRIGLETIVGLVPGVGDLVGGGFSLYIILQAARMGVPASLLARMGWNLVIDVVVGAVPFLGDLFDAGFKANLRNLALLERHAQTPLQSRRASRRFVAVLAGLLVLVLVGAFALAVFLVQLAFSRPVL